MAGRLASVKNGRAAEGKEFDQMALHVMEEANRCLGCKKPRCREGCPIHTIFPRSSVC